MQTPDLRVNGMAESRRQLLAWDRRVQERVTLILDKYALLIQREMQILAPVDTGFLRSSIIIVWQGKYARIVGPTADYAQFVEFGTRRMAPRPFVEPAALVYKDDFEREVQEALRA